MITNETDGQDGGDDISCRGAAGNCIGFHAAGYRAVYCPDVDSIDPDSGILILCIWR